MCGPDSRIERHPRMLSRAVFFAAHLRCELVHYNLFVISLLLSKPQNNKEYLESIGKPSLNFSSVPVRQLPRLDP